MRSLGKVLVIDDDPTVTAVYEVAFQLEHFQVQAVHSGSEALAALRSFKPDAVVLDLHMPGINGLRWLASVRAVPEFKDLPVVVLTGAPPGSPEVKAALDAGVTGVLTKDQWGAEAVIAAVKWSLAQRDRPKGDEEEPNWDQSPQ